LDRVARGATQIPAQTATCGQPAADPVARALCASPALGGLSDLYRALGLAPESGGRVAVATHSLGLSARTVSALNPRVFVFPPYSPLEDDRIAVAAFSRGEPFVELVGYDPAAHDFNFYLLAFRPSCRLGDADDPSVPWCAPRDLLTAGLETGWRGWTLFADRDLADTPLDCTSCHRPDGPGAPRRLLMRQVSGPWMHWGDFRGVSSPVACTDASGAPELVAGEIAADGADALLDVDGPAGEHAGIPVADLIAAPSGYDFSSFLFYAAAHANGIGDVPCSPPDCRFSEPLPFPSQDVLCDRLSQGAADGAGGAWARYRELARGRGFPVPYFDPSILDGAVQASVSTDFQGWAEVGEDDAFTKLSSLVDPDVGAAIGFLPDEADSGAAILAKMCARCHAGNADAGLGRARFDATTLDGLDAALARKILDRISLPRTSPERMPPVRAGELPDWARQRIGNFLRDAMAAD
jgi:hypothetical protein